MEGWEKSSKESVIKVERDEGRRCTTGFSNMAVTLKRISKLLSSPEIL